MFQKPLSEGGVGSEERSAVIRVRNDRGARAAVGLERMH